MVRAATAVFGAAVAIGIAPALQFRAAPGELPGALPAEGLSPAGPVMQFGALLLCIIAFAMVGNIAARYLDGIRWATVSYCVALFASPLPLMHFGNLRHVLLHGVVATGIVLARKLNPRFSRHDVVLLPVFLATYFAFLDIEFGKTAIATFERAAIAVFVLRLLVRRPLAFAAAPLAFLFEINGNGGWLALIWIVATPLMVWRSGNGVREITSLPDRRADLVYGSKEALMFILMMMVILSVSFVAGMRLRPAKVAVIANNRTRRIL